MARPPVQLRGDRAREAILAAAGERFLADGLRATSVEGIAAAAGVSRPTVYAHFSSKDEVFRTIVQRLYDAQLAAMQAAIHPHTPVGGQLFAVLEACFLPLVTLTSASAHGAELIDENSRVCGDITREARHRALTVIERVLDGPELDVAASGLTLSEASVLLYDAAYGVKRGDTITPAEYRRQLGRLVAIFSRGLAAGEDGRDLTRSPRPTG